MGISNTFKIGDATLGQMTHFLVELQRIILLENSKHSPSNYSQAKRCFQYFDYTVQET